MGSSKPQSKTGKRIVNSNFLTGRSFRILLPFIGSLNSLIENGEKAELIVGLHPLLIVNSEILSDSLLIKEVSVLGQRLRNVVYGLAKI